MSECVCARVIQQAFIDMENMFDLLKEEQEVSNVVFTVVEILICREYFSVFCLYKGHYLTSCTSSSLRAWLCLCVKSDAPGARNNQFPP